MNWLIKIIFNFFFYIYKKRVASVNSLLTYPIIIQMELNKDQWFENYKNGQSINSQVKAMAELTAKQFTNSFRFVSMREERAERRNKLSSEDLYQLHYRYNRFVEHVETKRELEEAFPEHFK